MPTDVAMNEALRAFTRESAAREKGLGEDSMFRRLVITMNVIVAALMVSLPAGAQDTHWSEPPSGPRGAGGGER